MEIKIDINTEDIKWQIEKKIKNTFSYDGKQILRNIIEDIVKERLTDKLLKETFLEYLNKHQIRDVLSSVSLTRKIIVKRKT